MKYIFTFVVFLVFLTNSSFAQESNTLNSARVGNHRLSLSGFIAPFASVVMTTDTTFLASTVADQNGNFSFANVLVNKGLKSYCLEAIDAKNIGSSYTCFEIDPVITNVSVSGVFLPPTLGLSGTILQPGAVIIASGYSMPGARVILNIGQGIIIDTFADQDGFWSVEIRDLTSGKYQLFATANYQDEESEKPDRTVEIEAFAFADVVKNNLGVVLVILFIIILSIILAIALMSNRLRNRIRSLFGKKPIGAGPKGEKPLHHEYFMGY